MGWIMKAKRNALARRDVLGAAATLALCPPLANAQTGDAKSLMRAAYQTSRFDSARFEADLTLQGAGGDQRRRTMQGVGKVIEGGAAAARMIRFASPADIRGAATLTVERQGGDDDLWIYLPALRTVRRLVSSNKRDAWLGSEFSLGDIVGHKVDDWQHAISGEETLAGAPCWRIESLPARPQVAADTGYSRRMNWIRQSDSATVRMEAFGLSGGLLKRIEFNDLTTFPAAPAKRQAMTIVVRAETGAVSTMRFTNFAANTLVAAADISPDGLEE
jgi:hypothetical protein